MVGIVASNAHRSVGTGSQAAFGTSRVDQAIAHQFVRCHHQAVRHCIRYSHFNVIFGVLTLPFRQLKESKKKYEKGGSRGT